MRWSKRVLRTNETLRAVLIWLIAAYIRLVRHTGQWTTVGGDIPRTLLGQKRAFVVVFWHSRLLMMPFAWVRGAKFHMLHSHHPDGLLIARAVRRLGISNLFGSTGKGGIGAFKTMIKVLRAGEAVGITPDGPKGPRQRLSMGAVTVARMAGVPLVPLTYGVAGGKQLDTWDRFLIPFPFSRGAFIWGDPVDIPPDADDAALEAARLLAEERLNAITRQADGMFGRSTPDPGPAP